MEFDTLLSQVLDLLQREGRMSYRAIKVRFQMDDDHLEAVKDELIYAKKLAVDEDGRVLVWATAAPTLPAGRVTSPVAKPAVSQATEPERQPLSYTPPHLAEKILTSKGSLEGERKQVTVLFADIKDSTELIRDLDPEDAQKLLDPAIHIMMEAVHRFEGTVNQVLGDGVMSLFGAPIAHEDHAARACYAALAVQAAMRDYTEQVRRHQGLELHIRVGLNSGEVVVRTIGNDLHMDYSAVGPTTHLAARMEQLAHPGSIRLSAATLRLVEGLVQVNDLGPVPVKGMLEPVQVYELTGASSIRRRLQAAVARGLTKFVGRDTEIDTLNQALERARAGHGQLVAAVGEAGVGKSRLMYEFVHSHRTQGWLVLESASVSYGKATPYFPVIDLLKRYVHVEDGDDARTIRAKVTGQILTLDESLQETIPALLSLLEALPEDSPFLQLEPPQRRQRTLDGLQRILLRESQVQPLVLVFEDLHWQDSKSQVLLDSLIESLPTAQLLLLVNYRPEYTHSWGNNTFYTQLRLDPLLPESADELLDALLGDDSSLVPLKKLLIQRTEGNPFFLEESVRTLVETRVLAGAPGAYRLAQALPTIQVPATVQAVLAARIDRLPQDEKSLLQTASVIGNELPFPLLQTLTELSEATLYRGLIHLQAAEFLYEASLYPERVYTFKHALTHEVAYGGLLQERRRVLHARIVEALETLAGGLVDDRVERLAHHALRGEVWAKAVVYFRQAGAKALARSAHQEAAGYFEQALSVLAHLPEQRDTREQSIDIRLALRSALLPSNDSPRILACLREAEALAMDLNDARRLGQVSGFLSVHFRNLGAYDQAIAAARRALTLATAGGDLVRQGLANLFLGATHWAQGDYPRAIDCLHRTIDSFHGAQCYERFGQATLPAVQARAFFAACAAELGQFAPGRSLGEEGLRMAEAVAHPSSLMWAYYGVGLLALRHGDLPRALPWLERAMGICQDADLTLFFPRMAASLGAAYTLGGRVADAVPLLTQAMEQMMARDMIGYQALCGLPLGEAQMLASCLEDAHALAERALAFACEHQEHGNQAYTLYLLGDIAMRRHPPELSQTETHYQRALDLALDLGMRPLQAHCHRGLGTVYSQTGQAQQARVELAAAIDLYRDMGMTFWLPETEAALAAVEGRWR
jgi:class 3 adenylate cyclase/tetratricopeptide (TPR) repeat protein